MAHAHVHGAKAHACTLIQSSTEARTRALSHRESAAPEQCVRWQPSHPELTSCKERAVSIQSNVTSPPPPLTGQAVGTERMKDHERKKDRDKFLKIGKLHFSLPWMQIPEILPDTRQIVIYWDWTSFLKASATVFVLFLLSQIFHELNICCLSAGSCWYTSGSFDSILRFTVAFPFSNCLYLPLTCFISTFLNFYYVLRLFLMFLYCLCITLIVIVMSYFINLNAKHFEFARC